MYIKTGDKRIQESIIELCDYLCKMQYKDGIWVKETLLGLNRSATLDEQEQWLRLVQVADCALSIANVIKYLG